MGMLTYWLGLIFTAMVLGVVLHVVNIHGWMSFVIGGIWGAIYYKLFWKMFTEPKQED